jgi:K+-transporting ATPase ATPase A chain
MNIYGWSQLAVFVVILVMLTKPIGTYLVQVLDVDGKPFLSPVLRPLERLLYHLFGLDPKKEQSWQEYTISLLAFSLVSLLATYAILRLQHLLPLNPQNFGAVSEHLAFNTAVSFTTNTNWQSYGGESTLSYFSQMVGLVFHNFTSAAVGIAVAAVLVRGVARQSAKTIGNFWSDLIRVNIYLLLPISIVYALILVSQGMIQNFRPYATAQLVEVSVVQVVKTDAAGHGIIDASGNAVMEDQKIETQTIPQGPAASQAAIKMLGTNGGGFFNANASHPFENPTPLSNFLQILSIFLIPSGLTYYLGRMVKRRERETPECTPWGLIPPEVIWRARRGVSAYSVLPSSPLLRRMPHAELSTRCMIPSHHWAA